MGMQSCTVLIVASAPAERRAYRNLLADDSVYHYTFLEAEQGTQAIRFCQQSKPDCVLLAAHLPDMDSVTLLQTLLQTLGPERAALLMVVSSSHDDLTYQAMQNGAHDYLCKDEMTARQVQHRVRSTLEKVAWQRAVAHQHRWLHALATNLDEGVMMTDPAGQITFINDAAVQLTGRAVGEAVGQPLHTLMHWIDAQTRAPIETALATVEQQGSGDNPAYQALVVTRDGQTIPVAPRITPVKDAHGESLGHLFTLHHPGEEHKATALDEGEIRFRQLADAMPQIVWTTTPTGIVDYFNEQWFTFTGLSVEAGLANANGTIHPDDRAAAVAAWQAARLKGEAYEHEMRLRRYDGVYHWFLARCVPDYNDQGQIHRWYGTSTDITERKQAEEQLRYQAFLLENVQDAVISTDMNFRIVTWNRGAEQLYGWLAIEVIGRNVSELLQTAYLDDHTADVLNTFIADGRWQGEVTQRNQAGARITVSNVTVLLYDPQGRPLGAVAVNRDITARKQAEDAHRRSEERLRLALAGGRMGIWEWHDATEKSLWNEQEYALFGLPHSTEITYDLFVSLIHPEDWPHLKGNLDTALAGGGDYSYEFRIIRADGEERWLAEYGVGIIDEHHQQTRLLGINFDITERKVQEKALHQLTIELEARVAERTAALKAINEKLEATNRELEHFTYAAAHDLKSPLRGIQNLV